MAYCGPKGIPLSAFLEWADADRVAALEWQSWESRRCQSCGTHPEDWEPGNATHAARLHVCEGCVQTERVGRSQEVQRPGMKIRMERI